MFSSTVLDSQPDRQWYNHMATYLSGGGGGGGGGKDKMIQRLKFSI